MLFTPKGFLKVGGIVLILVGILGMVGLIGPTIDRSIFGEVWYFTPGENWAHLILGIVAILAAWKMSAGGQKSLAILVGILGIFFAVYNVFSEDFLGAHLEQHADTILHLVVGIWALVAGLKKGAIASAPANPMPQPPNPHGQ